MGRVELNFLKMKRCLLSALAVGLFMTANVMAQVPSYVPTNGLVGYWPFNGNANDASGNGNNGTVNGATLTTDRFGNSGKAYSFDGVDDFIETQNSIIPNQGDFSINFWIYSSVNSGFFSEALSQGGTLQNSTYIGYTPAGKIRLGGGSNWSWDSNLNFPFGNWHMFTVTRTNSISYFYIDNILLDSSSLYVNPINSGKTIFGRQQNNSNNEFWNGEIDDIGIWNRALTQEEITNLYNGCSASTITSQPSNQAVNPTTSAQFIVNATSGSSFQWQTDLGFGFQNLSNAGQYSGANNDTLVVSNASTSNNNQQFRCIVNSAGCADTSNIAVLTVSTVGMDELSVQGNVSLYPNPTQSSFEIQTSLVYSKIEIRDMQGRIVKTENAAKTINLSSLEKGTYSVNLLDEKENTLVVRKIVLQ